MQRFAPVSVDHLILSAQKPSRYVGGEVNSIVKDLRGAEVTWALAFPDVYEVGMSNLGFRVLYHVLNRRPATAAERVFMPWTDLAHRLRRDRVPLFTLESRSPVRHFDVLGFTLQFELCYTTVLAMLDLSGIPLFSRDRGPGDPLVIGGGPCAYSPEPVAPFFDAFVVGEGEEVVHEIDDLVLAWKRGGGTREELLWELAEIPGVYVPSLFELAYRDDGTIGEIRARKPGYERVSRRVVPDLNAAPFYEKPVLPFMQTIHDRLPIEIQRGCTRGCRFCQVGMLTRPTRQRDPREVLRLAERGLATTGYEEVSFLSLSAGDYQCLNGMLEDFFDRYAPERIAVGIPSLRTETMNRRLAEQIRRVRKGGFTVAPEAASERMRRVINKGNEEKHLLHAVETIFGAGWELVKFYFMIGLPTERDQDVRAIAELSKKALALGRRHQQRASIHVGVSTFVPKPFTPFQWEPQMRLEETRRKHALLQEAFGGRRGPIEFRYHEAETSQVEAGLCLSDRRAAHAVLAAYRRGQVLDGWGEHFSHRRWLEAFAEMEKEHGVGLDFFAHREKGRDEILPWEAIDCEVTKPYLWRERERSYTESAVVDCAIAPCTVCSACDYEVVKTRVYDPRDHVHDDGRPYDLGPLQSAAKLQVIQEDAPAAPAPPMPAVVHAPPVATVRVRFAKTGRAIAISQLETVTALTRALRRAEVPMAFTQGFTPRPALSFGPALPVGVESSAELFDLDLCAVPDLPEITARLAREMPAGFELLDVALLPRNAASLGKAIAEMTYRARVPGLDAQAAVAAFAREQRVPITREGRASKGRGRRRDEPRKVIDLKHVVAELRAEDRDAVLFRLRTSGGGSARPSEVLEALFGGELPEGTHIRKESVTLA